MSKKIFGILIYILAITSLSCIVLFLSVFVYNRYYVTYEYSLAGWPASTQRKAPVEWKPDQPERVRILAISGGALLGLSDLQVLMEIEKRSGKRIYELFDFIAGTSTGAIVSTLLLFPFDDDGLPMSAVQASAEYETLSADILTAPLFHRVMTGNGLFGPRLKNHARILDAHSMFGEAKFNDLLRPAMFPSVSMWERGLRLFMNWHPDDANVFLFALLSAVTSAPTYFPAIRLTGDNNGDDFITDAGLVLNAPGDIAFLHARTNVTRAREFIVVMLDTSQPVVQSRETSIYGGFLRWLNILFAMTFSGESSVSRHSLERHQAFESDIDVTAFFLVPQAPANIDAFDPSPENIEIVRQIGQSFVRDNSQMIDNLIALLLDEGRSGENPSKSDGN